MKPKNKFQQRIVEASKSLPRLTKVQIQWGYGELINTLCGCDCPNCKADLKILTTKKQVFDGSYYMTIITAHKGYQVLRTVMVKCFAKVGKLPEYTHSEVMQRWIAPDGKHCTFAKQWGHHIAK